MRLLLGSEEHTSELQSPCNLVCGFCLDRKSTRLNSSHLVISYAVFCLKKKKDSLSRRGQGKPRKEGIDEVVSRMQGGFRLETRIRPCIRDIFFFLMIRRPPESTLFPYPALSR